jgi:hypothetical protein
MTDVAYDGLADVYDWLVPEALLTPEGTVAAFSGLLSLPPVGRVLDSACGGRRGLVVHSWTIPDSWDARHFLEVGVALIDGSGKTTTVTERLPFWPFTHSELDEDLRRSGFTPESSTYAEDVDRYLVTARRLSSL